MSRQVFTYSGEDVVNFPAGVAMEITVKGACHPDTQSFESASDKWVDVKGGKGGIVKFKFVSEGLPLIITAKNSPGSDAKIYSGDILLAHVGGGGQPGRKEGAYGGNAGFFTSSSVAKVSPGLKGGVSDDRYASGGNGGSTTYKTLDPTPRKDSGTGRSGGWGGYGYYNGGGGSASGAALATGGGGGAASYIHDINSLILLSSADSLNKEAYSEIVIELLNSSPEITLNTLPNTTLYENDTLNIDGSVKDADTGNSVTVRYQVNANTVRAIKAFVSDGTTLEAFSKQLTFKGGSLYEGDTLIASGLTDGVAHKLKVWATDDVGGTSTIVERSFYVVPNRAPSLTVDAPIIAGNIDSDKFKVNGSYNDADGNTTTVKYRINGSNSVQVASGTSGVFDFEVSFGQLVDGLNTIVVEAIDSYGAKTSKTVKLNKNVLSTEQLRSTARYKILPPTNAAEAVLLWIERDKNLDIDVAVSMTMAGEAESFVPLTASESVPIANGSTTYEDTFFYEVDSPKDNIIVQIDMTRQSVEINDKITLISGVLE